MKLLAFLLALGLASFSSGCCSHPAADPADVALMDRLIDKMVLMAETPGPRSVKQEGNLDDDGRIMHALNQNIANPATRTAVYVIAPVRT